MCFLSPDRLHVLEGTSSHPLVVNREKVDKINNLVPRASCLFAIFIFLSKISKISKIVRKPKRQKRTRGQDE